MSLLLKRAIVHGLLRLQWQPFLFFFRRYYGLAVWASVRCLRRVSGVEAVYLAGSLATGHDVLHGISDVDFIVFMLGKESEAVRSRIDRRLARLRLLFPVLGADRKAVYFLDDFPTLHAEFPILQHLFDPMFFDYRLLRGRDVIADLALAPLTDESRRLSILWKLKYWTEKIILIVCSRRLTPVQKNYALFKAMDDVARLARIASRATTGPLYPDAGDVGEPGSGPGAKPERGQWIEAALTRLDPEPAAAVAQLLQEQRAGFRGTRTDQDALLAAFWALLGMAVQDGSRGSLPALEGHTDAAAASKAGTGRPHAPEAVPAALTSLSTCLDTGYRLRPLPLSAVTASITDCDGFGRPAFLLVPDRLLTVREIQRLKVFQEEELQDAATLFVQAGAHLVHAVSSEMMEHWLYTPVTEESIWLSLARTPAEVDPLEATALGPDSRRMLEGRLAENRNQIRRIFGSPEVTLIPTVMHAKLVLSALSRLVLCRELTRGRFVWPQNAGELSSYLKKHTPLDPAFLDRVLEAYQEALAGTGHSLNGYFPKLHALVLAFLEAREKGESLASLASLNEQPDRPSLSISVVIITRNRCRDLERCLEAILRVRRAPDEILVVDNGSTDATREVVDRIATTRPIRYVLEPKPGVSHARNAGSRAARGDILAFMDDDAVPREDWLENIENAFLKSPAIGIVGGAIHHHRGERDDWITTYYGLQEGNEPC
jgi:glycosyl transferase family 2